MEGPLADFKSAASTGFATSAGHERQGPQALLPDSGGARNPEQAGNNRSNPGEVSRYSPGATPEPEWKPVPGWPYECTIDGRLRQAQTKRAVAVRKGRTLADGSHYLNVELRLLKRRVTTGLHRVVAMAWIGPIPPGYEINHLDANKLNNHAENLEICTRQENMRHAKEAGLISRGERHSARLKPEKRARGSRNGRARLTFEQVREILQSPKLGSTLAVEFGVSRSTIYDIRQGRNWKHLRSTDPEAQS